ncbi:hypothetical protein M3I01_007190 [Marinomonas sp. RSW2]|uniref:Outer membrane protein beta-barrel domain-containing protein n=1 Tax=Marinomonas maritima TaxID=2940935 RepID=A0ABT5WD43_9GAMM|nr:hypothetical protein [Marinomonas maritima]MDE8602708.1 hypothetical protein [Marinomonas maritima]
MKFYLMVFILLSTTACSNLKRPNPGPFVGYELVEMGLNEFDEFAGEVGYNFDSVNQVRLVRMDVNLKERHLKSDEASAVTGSGVTGSFEGWEISYDRYLFDGNFFVSLNAGEYEFDYYHKNLNEMSENKSITLGAGLGYTDSNFLDVEGLYLRFSYPIRFLVDKVDEKQLGSATVNELKTLDNVWFFLGYAF